MKRKLGFITLVLLLLGGMALISGPPAAHAEAFQTGDVFAATGEGNIQHWRPGSGVVAPIATYSTGISGETTGMAFDSFGNLYVTNFTQSIISKFDNSGSLINPNFITSTFGSHNESIIFNSDGNFYVGYADGNRDVVLYNTAGTPLDTFNVATESRGSDWIDLAADQQTLYYTSEGYRVKRYDLSTKTQLADFAVSTDRPAFAIRILSDGGILVANTADIKRFDSTGTFVQSYDVGTDDFWFAMNLDPDGTSFWSADYYSGNFYQFDINSGFILDTYSTGSSQLLGLTVFGEITQGGGNKVPEPSTLLLLGTGLIGLVGMRRKFKV